MTNLISSKLPGVGTTIVAVMSQLAADTSAINLSQGYPGFDPPRALTDRVRWYLEHGGNQYAPMTGLPALRQVIADKPAPGSYGGLVPLHGRFARKKARAQRA